MTRYIIIILINIHTISSFAQEEAWDSYTASFEEGAGAVLIDMNLIHFAPLINLPFVVVTGVHSKSCDNQGFPDRQEFSVLYDISDVIKEAIDKHVSNRMVGTFTHQCNRLDYYYVQDTIGLRNAIDNAYTINFPSYHQQISIDADKEWTYYHSLYPTDEIQEYMANDKVIFKLMESGDDLSKPREVNHWIYFQDKEDRKKFVAYAEKNGYETKNEKKKEGDYPYGLKITRQDYVMPGKINPITHELNIQARTMMGKYDGWNTVVIKNH